MTVLDNRKMWWWPPAGTIDEYEFAEETLDTVQRIAMHAARTYYVGLTLEDVRDDLESWLTEYTFTFRRDFDAFELRINQPILDQWCAVLHATLTKASKWYLTHNRPGGMTGGSIWWLAKTTQSSDAPLNRDDEPGMTVGQIGKPLWGSSELTDPAAHLFQLETIREAIANLRGYPCDLDYDAALAELDRLAGEPRRGQCGDFGCPYPPMSAKKGSRCYYHSRQEYYENSGTCSKDECDGKVKGRGLCARHLQRQYDAEAPPCTVDDCERPQKTRGLCSTHYRRKRASREIQNIWHAGAKPAYLTECSIDGCEAIQKAKGYCRKHYQRLLKSGSVEAKEAAPTPTCEAPDCDRVVAAKGLCSRHYTHAKRGQLPGWEHMAAAPCSVSGCTSPRIGRGYCLKHYSQYQRGQLDTPSPDDSGTPDG